MAESFTNIYTKRHKDSAPLRARGGIPRRQLRALIRGTLQRPVHFVLELNEPNGRMLEAPNTNEYLRYVLSVT